MDVGHSHRCFWTRLPLLFSVMYGIQVSCPESEGTRHSSIISSPSAAVFSALMREPCEPSRNLRPFAS